MPGDCELLENDREEPHLVFEADTLHLMVDPDDDLFYLSSFGSRLGPSETFSGGNAFRYRSPVARMRSVGPR